MINNKMPLIIETLAIRVLKETSVAIMVPQ